jgi:hypothetical protein
VDELENLTKQIKELTGWAIVKRPRIVTDTTDCMKIYRGDILRIADENFVIRGNKYETRFGIGDQPKYWVFSAIDLKTGKDKIIKTVFFEEFKVRIGVFNIKCYRSPEKEEEVLDLVKGDRRFMQGYAVLDEKGNNVRIIDLIKGRQILNYIVDINKSHEQYFYEDLPGILHSLLDTIEAIKFLHDNGQTHGDIRNDHIIIDKDDQLYRWIDFDLKQKFPDFDTWCMGNILNYAVGKGINSFQHVLKNKNISDDIKNSLTFEDASAFYEYRIMNLKKLYPYLPEMLTKMLQHFTIKPRLAYNTVTELLIDYIQMLDAEMKI